jgi:copper(I)-binding protein
MKLAPRFVWLCVALVACSNENAPLVAVDIVIAKPLPGVSMGAGYMTLRNPSGQSVRIDHVKSPQLVSVEMHESVLEDDVARMRALPEILIPAGQSVRFQPGGKHLMIRHPVPSPESITLQFFDDKILLLEVNVRPED